MGPRSTGFSGGGDVGALKASRWWCTPQTSANMGPGFDCLAVAVGLYDEFTFTVLGEGPSRAVTYDASGLGQARLDRAHRPPQGPAARSLTVLTRSRLTSATWP